MREQAHVAYGTVVAWPVEAHLSQLEKPVQPISFLTLKEVITANLENMLVTICREIAGISRFL